MPYIQVTIVVWIESTKEIMDYRASGNPQKKKDRKKCMITMEKQFKIMKYVFCIKCCAESIA